jgi:Universal stress protein family
MQPVLVGLDGGVASLCALDLAAEEALGRVTPLDVLHVHARPAGDAGPVAALPLARDMLDAAVVRVRADHPGLAVRGTFVIGDPVPVLLRHAASACLVVLGHSASLNQVGPVAGGVAAGSAAPVILCRPFDREHRGSRPRPVLVAVGGAAGCDAVLAFAFEEAALRGAPILAHHLRTGPGEPHVLAAEALSGWSAKYPQVEVVHQAGAAAGLIEAAHDAQLVVVGRGGLPGQAGAPGRALMERAGCSVAVIGDC